MSESTHTAKKRVATHIHADTEQAICFGSFRLLPRQRLLLRGRKPVHVGSRALDILIVLVERPGELVGKDELMALVWPNTFVHEANLTVHIAALRRALCDGCGGHRFLINIPGRGYRFVAPVHVSEELALSHTHPGMCEHVHSLPEEVTHLIGRDDVVAGLSARFSRDRLLTVVGPGGIGKTAVALAIARQRMANYRHGVKLIDLAPVAKASLVPIILASTLGFDTGTDDPSPDLSRLLKEKEMLIVLDNCEHVVGAAANFVAEVLRVTHGVHVLATSREPLRTEGERLYWLPPLDSPRSAMVSCAEEALRFSAIQLFVDRTAAALGKYALRDDDASVVAHICSKLDGLPLAIELAANRVCCLGVRGLARRLDDPLGLLINGNRTAPPRQHTMRAALDWSYDLLNPAAQRALRRLSLLPCGFTPSEAEAIISDDVCSSNERADQVMELIAKSFIDADVGDAGPRLRLFDITRAYALARLIESGEFDMAAARHAECFGEAEKQRSWIRLDGSSHGTDCQQERQRSRLPARSPSPRVA